MQAVLSNRSSSRALKTLARFVLASLGSSTYRCGYASIPRSLRPRWTNFLNALSMLFGSTHMRFVPVQSAKNQQSTVVWL